MRLSNGTQNSIKSEILSDLYDDAEEALDTRRKQIAKRNRDYYIEPYLEFLAKLPDDLIAKERRFVVKICYNINLSDSTTGLREEWTHTSDKAIPNPVSSSGGYYSTNPATQELDVRLRADAAILAEDIISLNNERQELKDYIEDTFNKWSGTIQLRKIWPASLHKYLPAEPPKKPKAPRIPKTKKEAPEIVEAPTTLKARLTTTLLEGS